MGSLPFLEQEHQFCIGFPALSRELSRAVDMGCWFSVGPAMLHGEKGRQLVLKMPRDRVLTESDGPFAQIGRAVSLAVGCSKGDQVVGRTLVRID